MDVFQLVVPAHSLDIGLPVGVAEYLPGRVVEADQAQGAFCDVARLELHDAARNGVIERLQRGPLVFQLGRLPRGHLLAFDLGVDIHEDAAGIDHVMALVDDARRQPHPAPAPVGADVPESGLQRRQPAVQQSVGLGDHFAIIVRVDHGQRLFREETLILFPAVAEHGGGGVVEINGADLVSVRLIVEDAAGNAVDDGGQLFFQPRVAREQRHIFRNIFDRTVEYVPADVSREQPHARPGPVSRAIF